MSLINLNDNGIIKESWHSKKSTKRLEIILFKCRRNYNTLYNTMLVLKIHNLPIENVEILYEKWVHKAAMLDNIVYRRSLY
jgi:hypothetical protein